MGMFVGLVAFILGGAMVAWNIHVISSAQSGKKNGGRSRSIVQSAPTEAQLERRRRRAALARREKRKRAEAAAAVSLTSSQNQN